ncbi:MAG TPA: ATP-binding protein, partial [Planctomycetota bacterium]|nr:ATP-binding protein [Planctomycetota bacterium]
MSGPRRSRWRAAGVAALFALAVAVWLLWSSGLVEGPGWGAHLGFAAGLGAALYLAIGPMAGRSDGSAAPEAQPGAGLPAAGPPAAAGGEAPLRGLAAGAGSLEGAALHDIRNVLTAIGGHAELALRALGPGGAARQEIEGLAQAVERCARLTGQLAPEGLEFPRPIGLNAVVLDMRPMLARLLGESIDLVVVPGASRSTLAGSLVDVERLLLNLAVNARDAMPAGGVLRIVTENVERPPDPEHSDPGGPGVALVVQDNGPGLDAATRARLLEPVSGARPGAPGRGLGLSIVKEA